LSRLPDRLAPLASFTFTLIACAAAARTEAVLDVAGRVVATEPRLEVSLTLTNRSDRATGPIDVVGELAGQQGDARLASGLEPRGQASLTLDLSSAPRRPGRYALTLLFEHPLEGRPDGAGNPPLASERGWLMLSFGASPGEAVRLEAEPLTLDARGTLAVRLESRDAEGRRVRLRALTPRGLRAEGEPIEVDVPPRGVTTARVPILRTSAARGSRATLLLVAETPDAPLADASVAAVAVDVIEEPSRVARLRPLILTLGLALLAAAAVYELWSRRA
jgi:hypothetical protein